MLSLSLTALVRTTLFLAACRSAAPAALLRSSRLPSTWNALPPVSVTVFSAADAVIACPPAAASWSSLPSAPRTTDVALVSVPSMLFFSVVRLSLPVSLLTDASPPVM